MSIQDFGEPVVQGSVREAPPIIGWMPGGLFILAIVVVWLLVARTAYSKEDAMHQPSRVGQLYGYTICLVAVLIGIFSAQSIITNTVTLVSPGAALQPSYNGGPSLTSFEVYRETRERQRPAFSSVGATPPKTDTATTDDLRTRYEALRADRLANERATALRSLMSSTLFFILAIVLFVVQWRWLTRLAGRGSESA